MSIHTLSLDVPDTVYSRLEERARRENRSVESATIEILSDATDGESDVESIANSMALLDEPSLWRAARERLPEETSKTIAVLNNKLESHGLTRPEAETLTALMRQYDRTVLLKAEAAAELHRRGRDVSSLLQP